MHICPMPQPHRETRIQKRNMRAIKDAALEVFSARGYGGATLDQIAAASGLSKPNLLYYFPSKAAIYTSLLDELLDTWLDPLRRLGPDGDPIEEIVDYVRLKLRLAEEYPRESRLFANEILEGAPHIQETITGPLKALVDEKAELISGWAAAGKIAPLDARHLIFSIWATTQHYADFDVQVGGILGVEDKTRFEAASDFLESFYRRALTPR